MHKKIHLICNAHLDPVWLWHWEDGAAEAVSTYRIAADFCEEEDEFIFNHNEALLYEYVEQLDPRLFARIQELVRRGRWHIAGGSFIQPDLNAPQAESLIRQFLVGLRYFEKKFNRRPTTAYNFDSFGQPAGLPQILDGCGFDSYIFCRPSYGNYELPVGAFWWEHRSGARILARRSDDHYVSTENIKAKVDRFLMHYYQEPETMILWGIGNHGGGVSRQEYRALKDYTREHPEYTLMHSTPENFFQAIRRYYSSGVSAYPSSSSSSHSSSKTARIPEADFFPTVSGNIEDCILGCYTSSAIVKRAHRRLENLMAQTERLASVVWWLAGSRNRDGSARRNNASPAYPKSELDAAWKDILFTEFHDILPGSLIKSAEEDALARLGHGEEILRRLRLRCFAALVRNLPKAREGEVPVFVFNPHGFPVNTVLDISYQLAHKSVPAGQAEVALRISGKKFVFQREKPEDNIINDWRIKVAVSVNLAPMEMMRLDASYKIREKARVWKTPAMHAQNRIFRSSGFQARIGSRTGLLDSFSVVSSKPGLMKSASGVVEAPILLKALCPVVFKDLDHSWVCGDPGLMSLEDETDLLGTEGPGWDEIEGRFSLCSVEEAVDYSPPPSLKWGKVLKFTPAVRIIEDGPVRRIVESVLIWRNSYVIRHYILYAELPYFDTEDRIFWGEKDRMLKIEVPLAFTPEKTISESLYGSFECLPAAKHTDKICQRWVAAIGKDRYLAVINNGSFAYSLAGKRLYLNVLRSPAYSSFNLQVGNDQHEKRYLPRQSQGEHSLRFRFLAGKKFDESEIRRQADILNIAPAWQVYFPEEASVSSQGKAAHVYSSGNGDVGDTYLGGDAGKDAISAGPTTGASSPSCFPRAGSFLTVEPKSVHLVAMKRGEKDDSLILRLLETRGKKTKLTLRLFGSADPVIRTIGAWAIMTLSVHRKDDGSVEVNETNLVEEPLEKVEE